MGSLGFFSICCRSHSVGTWLCSILIAGLGKHFNSWHLLSPWSFPGVLLSAPGRLTQCHKNTATLCSMLVVGSCQAGWKNSKCPGNPQKISCSFLAVWHAAETPLVSTAKHCCPCVLNGMRQNSGRPQLHMSAMCAGGSRLQPPQTF